MKLLLSFIFANSIMRLLNVVEKKEHLERIIMLQEGREF